MQRIERYGVIALVFLLVTIVAVSLWGERKKTDGWFSFLDRESKTARVEELLADASQDEFAAGGRTEPRGLVDGRVPLSDEAWSGGAAPAYGGPQPPPADLDEYRVRPQDSSIVPEDLAGVTIASEPTVAETSLVPLESVRPAPTPAREYTIRSGDTLSQIAQRELGTKNRWRELVELNPGLDPARLHVGTKIRLSGGAAAPAADKTPAKSVVAKDSSTQKQPAAGARTYTIRSGDTLSRIAQRELGTSERWRELVEMNPGLDPARLHVGRVLRLPGGEVPRETRVARAATAAPATAARSSDRSPDRSKVR